MTLQRESGISRGHCCTEEHLRFAARKLESIPRPFPSMERPWPSHRPRDGCRDKPPWHSANSRNIDHYSVGLGSAKSGWGLSILLPSQNRRSEPQPLDERDLQVPGPVWDSVTLFFPGWLPSVLRLFCSSGDLQGAARRKAASRHAQGGTPQSGAEQASEGTTRL